MTRDIGAWYRHAQSILHASQFSCELLETSIAVQCLISHVTARTRAWVLAHPDEFLTPKQEGTLAGLLEKLTNGEPLPYLLGHWEFFGLDFIVSPAVLIPRPETELLVEKALDWLTYHPCNRWVLDVGTGSGCIAAALALYNKEISVLAIDRSFEAIIVA